MSKIKHLNSQRIREISPVGGEEMARGNLDDMPPLRMGLEGLAREK